MDILTLLFILFVVALLVFTYILAGFLTLGMCIYMLDDFSTSNRTILSIIIAWPIVFSTIFGATIGSVLQEIMEW